MKGSRAPWVGALVGLAFGMPVFEVCLLLILAIDGSWFDASMTVRYLSHSGNVLLLLAALHAVTASVGWVTGWLLHRARSRRRLRVIPGGAGIRP